jgi:hypothetical protein
MIASGGQGDVDERRVDKRMRVVCSSARIESLEVTETTKALMIAFADGKVTSEGAVIRITASYAISVD